MESLRSFKSHRQSISQENEAAPQKPAQNMASIQQEPDLIDMHSTPTQKPQAQAQDLPQNNMTTVNTQPFIPSEAPMPVNRIQTIDTEPPFDTKPNLPVTSETVTTADHPVPVPADLHAARTEDGGRAQRELEAQLAQTASGPQKPSALQEFHDELNQVVPSLTANNKRTGASTLKPPSLDRGESIESDEFVDAKSEL